MFANMPQNILSIILICFAMCECKIKKPRFLSGLESEDLPNSFLETHFGNGEFSKTDKVN